MSKAPEDYTKENIQMAKRHMTRYSTPTVIKLTKTETMRFCYTVARLGRRTGKTRCWQGGEVIRILGMRSGITTLENHLEFFIC